jgi:molybdopterin-guanine dinucleotide biosynthesis protein A
MNTNITGVILAGGRAQRMGGSDKGLLELAGKPMISYVLDRLRPQVDTTLINANRNIARYEEFGAAVISDTMTGFLGPLAGMSVAMRVARTPYIVTVPCDSPFVPQDYVQRMFDGLAEQNAVVAVATDGDRWQPVFSLIETRLYDDLISYLEFGERKIDLWFKEYAVATVDFSDQTEAFLNINTPADKADVEQILLKTNL